VVVSVTGVLVFFAIAAVSWLIPALVPAPVTRPTSLAVVALGAALPLIVFLVPLSIAVAILRYRLWDVDVLIRRALIYGTLTAALVGLYWLGVVALQRVVGGVMGQQG